MEGGKIEEKGLHKVKSGCWETLPGSKTYQAVESSPQGKGWSREAFGATLEKILGNAQ